MTKHEEIVELYGKHVIPTYSPERVLVKGRGAKVWDINGQAYLDCVAGIAVVNVGHCHPGVVEAIETQAGKLMHVSNLFYNELQPRLAQKLSEISLQGKCFFCNSGAEANEALIKLARLWGSPRKKFEIVTMKNSFHGRTLATLAATGQTKYQAGFEPMPAGFRYAEFNNLESVREQITEATAAVLLEAVQGEGGVLPANPAFVEGVRALCTEKNILLFFDEVQCGMGRTGKWFGYQNFNAVPDAFSLAKSLGNGFPIGALVAGPHLSEVFGPGTHASTFGGSPLACAAALAVIEAIESEGLIERAAEIGEAFRAALEEFVGTYEHVKEVRGLGLMNAMILDTPAKPLTKLMAEKGILAIPTAETVVRFVPPLTIRDDEIEEALEILDEALAEFHGVASPAEDDAGA